MNVELEQFKQEFTEEEVVKPFAQIFNQSASSYKKNFSVSESLDAMFPEQKRQDREVFKTKEILGKLSDWFTDLQLKEIVTDIDFLVESWLDEFEREKFEGKTLKELLHEKEGL
jgi:hypothetical protein